MLYSDVKHTATCPISGEKWSGVHPKSACEGQDCVVHHPSRHNMENWPRHLRETTLVERLCRHGVGHPDPDSARFLNEHGPVGSRGTWGVHGCDGCCSDTHHDYADLD